MPQLAAGTYQFRIFGSNSGYTLLATSNNFTLTAPSMSVTPSTVSGGQQVTVSWSGVTSATTSTWIGLYTPGSSNSALLDWFYANSCNYSEGSTTPSSGSCTYKMPTTAGTYEFRLFDSNSGYVLRAKSNSVTVN
jgi:hypothetical protein